ncbi:MAG TPA: T9SS type A sorting domain-containing protein, partial [Saprospiraceae bacterium]|nr:T9SS type A sorting domain-containing protein [Saprospiraceae bacterium]
GRLSDGLINISWNDNVSNTVKDKILTIKVKVLKSVVDKSVLTLQKSQLAPELYLTEGADIQTASVQLSTISREKPDSDIFEVYQNVPNPFNASTVIGFNLPASNVATVKLFDLTGKLVYQNSQNFQKGYNTFTIDAQSLNLNGVLYYQIDTDTDSATRKMIIIK